MFQDYQLSKSILDPELLGVSNIEQLRDMIWVSASVPGNKIIIFHAVSLDWLGSFEAHASKITAIRAVNNYIWTSSFDDIRIWECKVTLSLLFTLFVINTKSGFILFT